MPVIFLWYDSRYDASDNTKKRKLVHGHRSVFRSEKCRHRVKPAIFCRGRFQFLDENSACFSHRQSGGLRHGFVFWNYSVRKYEISGSHWVVQRIRRRLLGQRAVRDENKIFVTRAWRRFCWMISTHMLLPQFLDENRRCFRSGGQTGVVRKRLVGLALPSPCL